VTEVYIAGRGIFYLFCSCVLNLQPVTIYEPDSYSQEIYWICKYELPTSRTSKDIIWEIQTDKQFTRGHFQSHNKDGGHTNRSVVVENPILHTKNDGSIFYRNGVIDDQSLHY